MHLKCSNGHEYFEGLITLHVKFLSNGISGYSGFNLHCKMHYGLYIILGNNISVLWFLMKERKGKKSTFFNSGVAIFPLLTCWGLPSKGEKHWRSIYCIHNRPAQKTPFWGSCPWRLVACLITPTHNCFWSASAPHYASGNRGGQFQMEIRFTDISQRKWPISFIVCWGSLWQLWCNYVHLILHLCRYL